MRLLEVGRYSKNSGLFWIGAMFHKVKLLMLKAEWNPHTDPRPLVSWFIQSVSTNSPSVSVFFHLFFVDKKVKLLGLEH